MIEHTDSNMILYMSSESFIYAYLANTAFTVSRGKKI